MNKQKIIDTMREDLKRQLLEVGHLGFADQDHDFSTAVRSIALDLEILAMKYRSMLEDMSPEPGLYVFKIYLEIADSDDEARPIGTVRADTASDALDKAAQLHEKPAHDLKAEQENMYTWHALNPVLQAIYEKATEELSVLGVEEGRYYVRRLNLFATEQEVSRVAALEHVLDALEQANNREHALILLDTNVPNFIDQDTHKHYIELVEHAEGGFYTYE